MAFGTRNNGQIKTFWPDDTATGFYVAGATTIQELVDASKVKWGDDLDLARLRVTPETIHTDCLTYDQYDPSDYTDFLFVELLDVHL